LVTLIPPEETKVVVEVVKLAMALIPKTEPGDVVPIPTLPLASMMKAVVEAEAVEVAATNKGRLELADVEVADTVNMPHGVDVPIPTLPDD
jgi:hypothetical protein